MPKKKADKKEFFHDGSDYLFSLSKFVGKKVVDLVGYPSDPFGGTPIFCITEVIFEDGTNAFLEGEHDVVYLPSEEKMRNMSEKTLQSFIE